MKALVLSGGGSRGAYQAGCWRALAETGWRPDLIVGTSVGAINGAMIASGYPTSEIEDWWLRLRQRDLLRAAGRFWQARRWTSMLDPGPLRRLLEAELDMDRLHAGIPILVTATCLETGSEVVWESQELTVDHFMATMALLPGLPAVSIAGRHYADGGHWGALPLRHALLAGATEVEVLLHDPIEPHWEPAPRMGHRLRRMSDITWHGRQAAEWEALQARMDLPRKHPLRLRRADVRFHAPDPPLSNQILRFDPNAAAKMERRGYEETRHRLGDQWPGQAVPHGR